MKISGTNRSYADMERENTDLWKDSEGKEVRNQIADAKNRLKELSTDKGLNEEERERKQKEIQQKIADLNKQLRLRQLELQRRQQTRQGSSEASAEEDSTDSDIRAKEEDLKRTDFSPTGTKAVIAAQSAMDNARSQGNLAASIGSKVRILQSEIKQDEKRGLDTRVKQEELKKLEKKAERLNRTGFGFLADASKEMQQAAKKDHKTGSKNGRSNPDGFVRPLKSPLSSASRGKTDIYLRGNMFSNVDFHF